jgi:hypothetical protein
MAKPLMEQLTFSVRRATDADKKSIWQVQTSAIRELCGTHYAHKDILQWSNLLSPKSHGQALREREVFVAEKGNEIIGYGQLNLQHEAIEAVYVSPTCVRLASSAHLRQAKVIWEAMVCYPVHPVVAPDCTGTADRASPVFAPPFV